MARRDVMAVEADASEILTDLNFPKEALNDLTESNKELILDWLARREAESLANLKRFLINNLFDNVGGPLCNVEEALS